MAGPPLRVIFAGTPDFAAAHLRALIDSEHQLLGVYTQPDRPSGRGKKLLPSPVKAIAVDAGLPVFQPGSLKDPAAQQALAELGADVMVVVAYGLILPQAVLDAPRLGCLNVHASLLPRWRGAAPIQRAIEAGDPETGITIMQMDAGLDTGDMLAKASTQIAATASAAALHDELAGIGPPLLLQVLADLESYQAQAERQDDALATYAHKLDKAEAQVDWTRPAQVLARQVRAFNPFPVSYTLLDGERIRIWQASAVGAPRGTETPGTIVEAGDAVVVVACGDGLLALESLQLPGGKRLPVRELLKSRRDAFAPGKAFELPAGTIHSTP
jgi:methionyl-tRNA formyltransferase